MRRIVPLCLCLCLLLGAVDGRASELHVREAHTRVESGTLVVDTEVDLELSPDPTEAVKSGVSLAFFVDIAVEQARDWLPSERILHVAHRIVIKHHSLSDKYLILGLPGSQGENFPTLEAVIDALSHLRGLPLATEGQLPTSGTRKLGVRIRLDVDALPAPLRLTAYASPSWWLNSGWTWWEIRPQAGPSPSPPSSTSATPPSPAPPSPAPTPPTEPPTPPTPASAQSLEAPPPFAPEPATPSPPTRSAPAPKP
jgi:hypothetical protein